MWNGLTDLKANPSLTTNLQELAPKHISVRVPAKINLSLKVAPLGEDGFHQLATVFHAVSIYDEVTVSMVKPGQEEISVGGHNAEKIPTGKDNLVSKALTEIAKHVNQPIHARIHIDKSIPLAGGMAGGSAVFPCNKNGTSEPTFDAIKLSSSIVK